MGIQSYDAGNPKPVLCDDQEGWDGEGGARSFPEGWDICILMLIHIGYGKKYHNYCNYPLIKKKKTVLKEKACSH